MIFKAYLLKEQFLVADSRASRILSITKAKIQQND